jgi:hypothetical protein
MTNGPDDPRFIAGIELVRRTGAKTIQIRFSDDEKPVVWFAVAGYISRQGRAHSSGKINAYLIGAAFDPLQALFKLLDEAIDGNECAHCHRPAGFVAETETMPLDSVVCWYIFDPETNTYMRGCEARDDASD